MIRKDVVIAIIATFCLTSTLFMITTSKSQSGVGEYNPWADYNEDGIIDIFDIVPGAVSFGAEGDPTKNVNVTNWPPWSPSGILNNNTQRIVVFSTEALNSVGSYMGGIPLDLNSKLVFSFDPTRTPFNITQVYISGHIYTHQGAIHTALRFTFYVNGVSESIEIGGVETDMYGINVFSYSLSNANMVSSIHRGINTFQIYAQSWDPSDMIWRDDVNAFRLELLIDYDC